MNKILLFFIFTIVTLSGDFLQQRSDITKLNNFKYKTVHDKIIKIPKNVKIIIASFEKSAGVLVNEYLNEQDADYLQKHQAVFIADISKMPEFFINMVALPKLKKYKHLIYINHSEIFERVIPNKENKITLLFVDKSKIRDIVYISTKEELKMAIEK